jgi:acyl carrier protein
MNRPQVISMIATTIGDFSVSVPGEFVKTIDEETILFGADGLLDSLGLVSVVLDIEQQVNDIMETSISVADDRAMSQERNPFRTAGSLADYILTLIEEEDGK